MATITGQQIADKAELLLLDETNIRWTESEILGWVNSAQREIVLNKPNALTTNGVTQLVAGTKQTIPTAGISLIQVVRNMGTAGTTPGRAITYVNREILDVTNPDWHSSTPNATVKHYAADVRDPKTFYVYPPQPGTNMNQVELIYSTNPTSLGALSNNISLDDVYETLILDYILYRAYSKDSETANAQKADYHYQTFLRALTSKSQGEVSMAPHSQSVRPASGRARGIDDSQG